MVHLEADSIYKLEDQVNKSRVKGGGWQVKRENKEQKEVEEHQNGASLGWRSHRTKLLSVPPTHAQQELSFSRARGMPTNLLSIRTPMCPSARCQIFEVVLLRFPQSSLGSANRFMTNLLLMTILNCPTCLGAF